MNISQLRYFVSVVEQGSFSAAAIEQCITVQGVSKAIADLEKEVGSRVLTRSSKGAKATPFGVAFYDRARFVLHSFDALTAFADEYMSFSEKVKQVRLAICCPPFFGMERAKENISLFLEKNIGVEVATTIIGSAEGCREALEGGSIDAAITIGEMRDVSFEYAMVGTVPLGILVRRSHSLAASPEVSLKKAQKYPLALYPGFAYFNDAVSAELQGKKVPFIRVKPSEAKADVLQDWVFNDRESAVVVPSVTSLGDLYPGCVTVPIATSDIPAVPIGIICLKGRSTPAFLALQRALCSKMLLF